MIHKKKLAWNISCKKLEEYKNIVHVFLIKGNNFGCYTVSDECKLFMKYNNFADI